MTPDPRILLLTDADVFAGTERHIYCLAEALRGLGRDAWIGCPDRSPLADQARQNAIPLVAIEKGGLIDNAAVRRVKNVLADSSRCIVHAHNGRTALIAARAVKGSVHARAVSTQHFLTPHHATRRGVGGAVYRLAHHWVAKHTHRFVAISQAVRKEMLARGEAPDEKIEVVLNGIPDVRSRTLTDAARVRDSLGIKEGQWLVVCAARLQPEKDVATLIDAMALLGEGSKFSCVIAGEGIQMEFLQSKIRELNISDRVRLLGFREDVLALIAAADVFVLASLAEPFGLVLLEAMALGKPVIATQCGGPPEIVQSGRTGLLVTPSSPSALAEALTTIVDSARLGPMGVAARERYLERFTAGRMAREMIDVYDKAFAGA